MSHRTETTHHHRELPAIRRARVLLAALSWSQPVGSSANSAHIWLEAGSPTPLANIDDEAEALLTHPPTLAHCEAALQVALQTSSDLNEIERIGRSLHHLHQPGRPLI